MQMISTAVGGLNNLNQLLPAVKALGARHSGYGVTTEHYRLVGEALLWTLERGLGQDFTPEARSAWANVYQVLAATMQAGAAEVGCRVTGNEPTNRPVVSHLTEGTAGFVLGRPQRISVRGPGSAQTPP